MKRLAFIAAMLTGTAAIAQQPMTTTPDHSAHAAQPATPDDPNMTDPAMPAAPADMPPTMDAPMGTPAPTGATPSATSSADTGSTMDQATPGGDWSVSPPAQPAVGGPDEGEIMAQPMSSFQPTPRSDYPPCSATVTDNCVQRDDPGGNGA